MKVMMRLLIVFLLACTMVGALLSHAQLASKALKLTESDKEGSPVEPAQLSCVHIRGGSKVVRKWAGTRKQLGLKQFIHAFCVSLFDPSYEGRIDHSTTPDTGKANNKSKRKTPPLSPFGGAVLGGAGAANFGPVCGPGGCR